MRAIRGRLPASLRWRLAAWVAGVMLVSAGAIFAVVYIDTGSELRGQIDRDIAGDTSELSQAQRPLSGQRPRWSRPPHDATWRRNPTRPLRRCYSCLSPGG